MTEYQKIFMQRFTIGKKVRNTDGLIGIISKVNEVIPTVYAVYVNWNNGSCTSLNINNEHIYIID